MKAVYVGGVAIAEIRRDGGTQIRVALDEATVCEYGDAIKDGAKLPPVLIFNDGASFWLVDGFHRVEAALRAGKKRINAEVREGTISDAILEACRANRTHGLRRSNADKRRAVETALLHPVSGGWSSRAIAQHVGVDKGTVETLRNTLCEIPSERTSPVTLCELAKSPLGERRKGLDGKERALPSKGSASGQPTPVHSPAGNPATEDDKGAGAPEEERRYAAPAPDTSRDRLINVERLLRDAQAEIAPLLAKGEAIGVQVALTRALSTVRAELGTKVSKAEGRGERADSAEPTADTSRTPVRERETDPTPEDAGIQRPAAVPQGVGAQLGDSSASPANPPPVRVGWPEPKHVACKDCGGSACGPVCKYTSRGNQDAARSPKPRGLRVVLETSAGDVPFEDFSQVGPSDAG